MAKPIASRIRLPSLTADAGGWVHCREPQRKSIADALALLSESDVPRPGNLRLAVVDRKVFLVGELPDPLSLLSKSAALDRFRSSAGSPAASDSSAEVGGILGDTGYAWQQQAQDHSRWRATAGDAAGLRCELSLASVGAGFQVRGRVASWEEALSATARQAMAGYLLAVHARVRCVRFSLESRCVSAVSYAMADHLEVELLESVAAVVAACRVTQHEVRALAHPAVAQAYLEAAV
jgi:hypothetical protein